MYPCSFQQEDSFEFILSWWCHAIYSKALRSCIKYLLSILTRILHNLLLKVGKESLRYNFRVGILFL